MEEFSFSLLYPSPQSRARHAVRAHRPNISAETVRSLGLSSLIQLKNSSLCDYFTAEGDVIDYRAENFSDMLSCPEIAATFVKVLPILSDIGELRRLAGGSEVGDDYLFSLSEIELYISAVECLAEGLLPCRARLHGGALLSLCDYIEKLSKSDYYKELNEKLTGLTSRVRDIKSVTIGVNLDKTMQAEKCGVLSINAKPFKSGDTIDKILRMSFANDEYTLMAPLSPFAKGQNDNQKTAMRIALCGAIDDIFKSSVRAWKKIVQTYVLDNTNFLLSVMPEIEFMVEATRCMEALRARGLSLCRPQISDEKQTFAARGLYNPALALAIDGESVKNDFAFDKDGRIFVLTGPNRGGKSVITCAVGLAAAFAQLGMLVPADAFAFSPADGIYTHFPSEGGDTVDKGRLGEECQRLYDIFQTATEDSIVLLDESLSSTGAYEASVIAAEVLLGFSKLGCRTLFSTHLHELAARVGALNEEAAAFDGAKIDTLTARIEENGDRTFTILRTKPDGRSYAKDIADKYGLSLEKISETIEKKLS
ncbi:MAG: hypothetical protein IJU41_05775 [Clostridia bacterium]|nr:hypothetical protein [Clostridia bacterium]